IWDDSTTNTEGDRPRRSTLRVARSMNVVVYPASQRWSVRFLGETVRKPEAVDLVAKPSEWPDSDCWLPGQFKVLVSRLSGAR
ncbi:MAG: hypothetical protein WBB85_22695, partial [Albidovulum sp.]|uniref:hypothetical protein n=1 Tax=Albidovulum sp. TaxID=1872424 RepID=UPI003CC0E920